MKLPPGLLFLYIVLLVPAMAVADDDAKTFPGIEALMTPQEFEAAGLDKLSQAEREALNGFLIRYTAEESSALLKSDTEVKKAAQEQEIVSVIQQPSDKYRYYGDHPEVRITRNFMGFFRMELLENGKTVQVKRLR